MKLAWTRLASEDLTTIFETISKDNPQAAQWIIDRIEQTLKMLVSHPNIGRSGRVEGSRESVVAGTPYVVPYRVREDRIEILAVIHGARRWPDKL